MRAGDAVDAISPLMTDKTASIRFAALEALGRIATPDAVRVLVGALGAADDGSGSLERTPVRDALVAAGRAAIPSLHTVLSASPSPPAATSASWVLGELHARAEAPSIVASMRRGALQTAAALHALSGAGTDAEVPVVLEFVADPSPIVRAEALRAAMALLDPNRPDGRAVEPLAAALRDARPSPQERARLVTLLGRTGAPRAAPLLVELTHANDLSLRISAIDALGNLGPAVQPQRAEGGGPDEALLEAIESREPVIRLRAAIALSQAGTARAREVLLARLDGGDEVDRPDVLTALGGVLARAPSDAAVTRLAATLELAAGPERDAVVEALGRAPSGSAVRALATVARSQDPADRREAAKMCAAQAADIIALTVARGLLADSDPSVRADAAWSLGTIGDVSDLARLESTARSSEVDLAVDSTAAVGRIAARTRTSDGASRVLCPLVTDARAYVRANALDGLALAGIRCGDGALERTALADDSSEDARAAAALAVSRKPDADDSRALDRCARNDSSGVVAARCRAPTALPIRTHPTLVYVVPEGADAPRPAAAYAMLLADGSIRAGMTDRRGAVFEPVAPEGEVTLRRPSAFAR
jgi:HEAT repeat protein